MDSDEYCKPLDLKGPYASLPGQCDDTGGQSPKMDKMQKMINDRYTNDCDPWGGMKNDNKRPGFPGA